MGLPCSSLPSNTGASYRPWSAVRPADRTQSGISASARGNRSSSSWKYFSAGRCVHRGSSVRLYSTEYTFGCARWKRAENQVPIPSRYMPARSSRKNGSASSGSFHSTDWP